MLRLVGQAPTLLVITGAEAAAEGRRDYAAFWPYALALCAEVRSNDLTPVAPCICLPDQVLAAVDEEVVHRPRAADRTVRQSDAGSPATRRVAAPRRRRPGEPSRR